MKDSQDFPTLDANSGQGEKPVLTWSPLILHYAVANAVAWLVASISGVWDVIQPFVDSVASVIPSIHGLSLMSPDAKWSEIYMLVCGLGVPFYVLKFWRIAAYVMPSWVRVQPPLQFWLTAIGLLVLDAGLLIGLGPVKSYNSVRVADVFTQLIKQSYLLFGIVGFGLIVGFSLGLGVGIKIIQLRLFPIDSDQGD